MEEVQRPEDEVLKALDSNTRYRESKSPETLMVRNIVEGPIIRRFKMQCATDDSPLWGSVPPRRLNKPLFNKAAASPLKEMFTRHASELANIPGEKVPPHPFTPTHTHTQPSHLSP